MTIGLSPSLIPEESQQKDYIVPLSNAGNLLTRADIESALTTFHVITLD